MSARDVEEALSALLGSRRKARALLGATSLRHLVEAPPEELETWLPRAVARRFHAAVQLARFALSPERTESLDSIYAAYAHFHPYLALRETERFVVAALDNHLRVLATEIVAEGAPDAVLVRPADVFVCAIRHHATAVLIAHNHPSGEMTPSREDYALTRHLVELGRALGIRVLDHLVVVGNGLWSLLHGDHGTTEEAARQDPSAY